MYKDMNGIPENKNNNNFFTVTFILKNENNNNQWINYHWIKLLTNIQHIFTDRNTRERKRGKEGERDTTYTLSSR